MMTTMTTIRWRTLPLQWHVSKTKEKPINLQHWWLFWQWWHFLALPVKWHWWHGLLQCCAPKNNPMQHWWPPLMLCPPGPPQKVNQPAAVVVGLFPMALVMLPPLTLHPHKTTCGVCGLLWCHIPKQKISPWHWWQCFCDGGGILGPHFQQHWWHYLLWCCTPQKQSTCKATGLWCLIPKESTCSSGDLALCFQLQWDIPPLRLCQKINLWDCWPLMPHPQKITCGIGDLVPYFQWLWWHCLLWCCIPSKTSNLWGYWPLMPPPKRINLWHVDLAPCFQQHWQCSSFDTAPKKQSTCGVTGLWHHTPQKIINL